MQLHDKNLVTFHTPYPMSKNQVKKSGQKYIGQN